MTEDHGVVGTSPQAVELYTLFMVVHALGIWSPSSHIFGLMVIFGHLVWLYSPEYSVFVFLFIRPSGFIHKALFPL